MKRSEAKEFLRKKLEGNKIDEDWTEQIISSIEELGMLPPTVCLLATDEYYKLTDLDILHDYDISFAWIPEDA